jgi:hypothetical protein
VEVHEDLPSTAVSFSGLTPAERQAVRVTGRARLLAGAGIEAPRNEVDGTELLLAAREIDPSIELIHVSLADRALAIRARDGSRETRTSALLRSTAEQLRDAAPDNALSEYTWAVIDFRDGDVTASVEALERGNGALRFESFSTERFLAVVDATEYAGHSRADACHHGLGFLNPMGTYGALMELCRHLADDPIHGGRGRRECERAGARIEAASRNVLETLVGLAIQRSALTGARDSDPQSIARIDARRDELLGLGRRLPPDGIPEDLALRHCETLVRDGEEAALRLAIHEREESARR